MSIREKIESKFESLSDFIFENRKKVFFTLMTLTVLLATNIQYMKMDTTTEGFLHKDDTMRVQYDRFRDQFGRDEKILIAVEAKDIWSPEFLEKFRSLHEELESDLPHIDEVTSIINARNTIGTEDTLSVQDLFEDVETLTKESIGQRKKLALENPIYLDMLYNKDQTFTNIIIDTSTYTSLDENGNKIEISEEDEFSDSDEGFCECEDEHGHTYLTDPENTELMNKVKDIAAKYHSDDFKIHLAGSAFFNDSMKQIMMADMESFIMKMMLAIVIVLFLMFRRISGIFLPIVAVALTVISTVATMAYFGAPFTMATQIMPSFLLAVITGGSIHILAIFYQQLKRSDDVKASLRYAMGHSGFAIVMTSLTTAAGMWSFSTSEVAPVADLGSYSALGMIYGLVYMLILMPALISMITFKKLDKSAQSDSNQQDKGMDKLLLNMANFSLNNAKKIVISSLAIVVVSVTLALQMSFSHHPLVWFEDNHEVRVAVEKIDSTMNGSMNIEIIIDTKKENGLYEPETLGQIEQLEAYLNDYNSNGVFVGKTLSITDILRETNKALHANQTEHYVIPKSKDLIAQELFLFANSGSDDLEDFVDTQFTKARITVKVPYVDAMKLNRFIEDVERKIPEIFTKNIDTEMTGIGVLLGNVMEKSIISSGISYLIAFAAITVMMIILMGGFKMGVVSMLPNILPILILVSIMSVFNIPLDMFTMLVGSIALGIAVDDTVHFSYNYNKYRSEGKSVDDAVRLTLLGTGRAIMTTSVVLSLGFLVLLSATMTNMINFGLLTASAIFIALIADFILMPAIFKLMEGNKND
jgi:predicted RND superfamily exporter protein